MGVIRELFKVAEGEQRMGIIRDLFKVTDGEQLFDFADLAFALAVLLISLGVGGFGWQYGLIAAGLIILLAVKPFLNWIR